MKTKLRDTASLAPSGCEGGVRANNNIHLLAEFQFPCSYLSVVHLEGPLVLVTLAAVLRRQIVEDVLCDGADHSLDVALELFPLARDAFTNHEPRHGVVAVTDFKAII